MLTSYKYIHCIVTDVRVSYDSRSYFDTAVKHENDGLYLYSNVNKHLNVSKKVFFGLELDYLWNP